MTLTANVVDRGTTPAALIERATAMVPELTFLRIASAVIAPGGTARRETNVFAAARRWYELSARPAEEILQPTAGSAAARAGERLKRFWRGLSTGHTHNGSAVLLTTMIPRLFSQARLGWRAQ